MYLRLSEKIKKCSKKSKSDKDFTANMNTRGEPQMMLTDFVRNCFSILSP